MNLVRHQTGLLVPIDSIIAHLAFEVAAGLSNIEEVKSRFNITGEQWGVITKNEAFQEALGKAISELEGDTNALKRIRLKAQVALEDSIPALYQIAHDGEAATAARVSAVQQMGRMAGVDSEAVKQDNGFSITINVNGKDPVAIQNITPTTSVINASDDEFTDISPAFLRDDTSPNNDLNYDGE